MLNFGKDKGDVKRLSFTKIYPSPRGDFCIFTTFEGENFLFIHKSKSIEALPKLKRVINALRFIDVTHEEDRSVLKLFCVSSTGLFSMVV